METLMVGSRPCQRGRLRSICVMTVEEMAWPPLALEIWVELTPESAELETATASPPWARVELVVVPPLLVVLPLLLVPAPFLGMAFVISALIWAGPKGRAGSSWSRGPATGPPWKRWPGGTGTIWRPAGWSAVFQRHN